MEDIIGRKHFAVAIVILEAYVNLKKDLKHKMELVQLDEQLQKRIIIFLGLVASPVMEWDFNKHLPELYNITCYLLCMLVINYNDVDNCFLELEICMKKEWDEGIMTKDQYLFHRRTNFELRRVIDRLNDKKNFNITYHNEKCIKIIYKHLQI